MEHPGVYLSSEEVVGRGDGVDVASEVKVELVHGNDLGVSSTCCSTLRLD